MKILLFFEFTGMWRAGKSQSNISDLLLVSKTCIQPTIKAFKCRVTIKQKTGSGCIHKTSAFAYKEILQEILTKYE